MSRLIPAHYWRNRRDVFLPMYLCVVYALVWTYAKPMCVLVVSITSGIVFNPIAGSITVHNQRRTPVFQVSTGRGPRPPKANNILPNGMRKLGERPIFCCRRDSNQQPLDRHVSVLPLDYHRYLTTGRTRRFELTADDRVSENTSQKTGAAAVVVVYVYTDETANHIRSSCTASGRRVDLVHI